jgi:hypothetical protein
MLYKFSTRIIFLLLGLFFSVIAGFYFNLSNGFVFQGFYLTPQFQLLDLAVYCSPEIFLNSQLIGYTFYLIFGIACAKKMDLWPDKMDRTSIVSFFLLIGLVFISDFYSFYQDLTNQFTGRHFRIGMLVFLIGLSICMRLQRIDSKLKE